MKGRLAVQGCGLLLCSGHDFSRAVTDMPVRTPATKIWASAPALLFATGTWTHAFVAELARAGAESPNLAAYLLWPD